MQQFIAHTSQSISQITQSIGDVKAQITKLNTTVGALQQEKDKFPSQTQANLVDQHSIASTSDFEVTMEHAKSITLRSGKKFERKIPQKDISKRNDEGSSSNVFKEPIHKSKSNEVMQEPQEIEGEKVVAKDPIIISYPRRLKAPQKGRCDVEMLELFQQVKVNIPLLDAIKQVPAYAKFLKGLCTVKRKHNMHSKVLLAEQVSSILNATTPPKYKDPRSPIISIVIGEFKFKRALLDLGVSVNLLPYSMYEKLGLGELKPTNMTLELADRSIRIPKGVGEDVLVQVDQFFYPIDFVVLDTQQVVTKNSHIPIILGRPFLATAMLTSNVGMV
ncbi:uncharacterized protein LOC131153806 [Malania oleifera]|uniref:uncharacterized protein LOC131153806 n=1 Tax=Malania oleifera TaxID=397392 RepID=UPI0025AE5028|nr:uncharacterized protein LOC131153806 [Malania oleifera]